MIKNAIYFGMIGITDNTNAITKWKKASQSSGQLPTKASQQNTTEKTGTKKVNKHDTRCGRPHHVGVAWWQMEE